MADPPQSPPDLDPFLDISVDLLVVLDPEGRFAWFNPAWIALIGKTAAEMRGLRYAELVHPADRARAEVEFTHLTEGREARGFRCRIAAAGGRWLWVEWNAKASGDGHLYGVGRDVTEQLMHVEALSEQNRLLQAAGDVAELGYWRVKPGSGQVFWSDAVFRIHGRDPQTFLPTVQEGIDAYHPDDRAMIEGVVAEALEHGSPFQFEARVVRPDGGVRNVLSRGLCETDRDGHVSALFGVFVDLTDIKRLEAKLRHKERMASIGTLAAGVAHEINNPLTFIMGNLDLLHEEVFELSGGSPAGRMRDMLELVDDAQRGAERVRRIVAGLRTFSRVDSAHDEAVDPNEALNVSLNIAKSELRHAATVLEDFGGLPLVRGDETRLVQVFVNLLVNAGQAVAETGRSDHVIRVTGEQDEDGWAVVVIQDDGPGIRDEVRQRIFDPFYTTKEPGEGTGLGLPIVLGIVQDMGGRVELDSEPGAGTTVTVKLPPLLVEAAEGTPEGHGRRQGRVLVVDDEPAMVTLLSRALQRRHEVVAATSGKTALDIVSHEDFHAIICDVMMPNMTGKDFYQAVSTSRPELLSRIIFVTAGITSPAIEAFVEGLPNPLVTKPIDLPALRAITSEVVAEALSER